ncbi:arylsulfatase [Haliea sp.]|jgi:arylsulfatase|nr:arylsulfatase [Haliea sp.]HBM82632.1 arylsulfatase [Halieaceae bacterium]MAD63403.1 arylsulfatase [Haliea sp.]MAY93530.1 arylsulfatase [Haliea sp.]MBK41289.1 arylsulfatase [Haliea sp.]MBP71846.1 arylsulfatase [Haliea sp.]|tara:strand:- start:25110 stop:26672 length:1563 start_codon:yes stop_codon:yes gene_type:complete
MSTRNPIRYTTRLLAAVLLLGVCSVTAAAKKPNILVIWGDDIGWSNLSAYHQGMLGGSTPNIDRIAQQGARFTDYYGEQSCTAGRSAFITGQHPLRTGLLKVGMPGAEIGLQAEDPTIAELLKPHGYATGQFGKNHLGDKDEYLPSNHGFDEFFGNLYHLNAEEEPETYFYPKDPEFRKRFAPRGVIRSYADGRIEDTGPLNRKRMETVDQEFTDAALDFMTRAQRDDKPFFVWFNATRMHNWTRLAPQWDGASGYGLYADGLMEHDNHVGQLLDKLDAMGIADDTIVIYSTDNGAQTNTYPDGGVEPFRGEKGSTWEGGFRVPAMIRWPGVVAPGTVINDVFSHLDWLPTLLAAAGEPGIKQKLLGGHRVGGREFKVYLDGYDQTALLAGEGPGKRDTLYYFDDNANFNALRWGDWKVHFAWAMQGWTGPREALNFPRIINLRSDPYETSIDSGLYSRFFADQLWLFVPVQQEVGKWLATFREFPPRQPTASFTIDRIMQQMQQMQQMRAAAAQAAGGP